MILHSRIIGQGTPFLILHGFLGMGDNWKTLAMRFSKLGYQVHLIDQRNHGRSFHNNVFDYEAMAKDLLGYCQFHEIKQCVILGHSMGGKTAMMFAAKYPEFIKKLIIADIAPRYYPVHHDAILEGLNALDFSEIQTRKQADEYLSNYIPELGVRQFLLKNLYWVSPGQLGLRLNLTALSANVQEVGEALPSHFSIPAQTLFLRGDRSEYISKSDENLISMQCPNSALETIPNAGHWLHAENPNAFFKAVEQFLS